MDHKAEWFMAVTYEGRYIVTQGVAELRLEANKFFARCSYAESGAVYANVMGKISDDGDVSCIVKSADATVPEVSLSGVGYGDQTSVSFVLSDGTTTVGICGAPQRMTERSR
jgi:hypothetical protein